MLAIILGSVAPVLAIVALAARDPLPRDCGSGQASATTVEGALLYTTGSDLWYSEGYPGKPRKIVDYSPPRVRRTVPVSPAGSAVPVASQAPSPGPSAVSPGPGAGASPSSSPILASRFLAADISVDRKVVAYLVADPPGHQGQVGVYLASPLEAPATAPVLVWASRADPAAKRTGTVRILDNGKVLVSAPVAAASLPVPSPAPARATPSSPPSPTAATALSPGLSSAPSAGTTPSPRQGAVAVVVVAPSATPTVTAQAPEAFFVGEGHSSWADTRSYHLPAGQPHLAGRVDGSGRRVAGRAERGIGTPVARRQVNVLLLGREGQARTESLCAARPGESPAAFSPDESELALSDREETRLIDLSGSHAATRLLSGRLLAWR
ncbi:MAG: hypothetical protein ABR573_09985 [Candidatus Dormibacteria bacterium]